MTIKINKPQAIKLKLSGATRKGVARCTPRGTYYNNRGTSISGIKKVKV